MGNAELSNSIKTTAQHTSTQWQQWTPLKLSKSGQIIFSREFAIVHCWVLTPWDLMNLFRSREQPLENSERIPDVSSINEQWFDCETHSPVNLKEGQRTPDLHISTPSICPGAPVRHGHSFLSLSDDDLDDDLDDVDSDDLDETGVCPLDSSHTVTIDKPDKEPKAKRVRREVKHVEETITTAESRYSDLHYLEAIGTVTIKRHGSASDEPEKRDCRVLVSYRVHKGDSTNIQIALIVYKSNTKTKTRRKLFQQKLPEPSSTRTHSSTSRSRTEEKDKKKFEEKMNEISTAPPGVKYSKATKRPLKTSLRF